MKIYQLTNTTAYQMMGYVIKTNDGHTIVIDGGHHNQSDELYRVLKMVGGHVDMWFITHLHYDHFGSVIDLFENHDDITVDGFWRNSMRSDFETLNELEQKEVGEWNEFERKTNIPLHEITRGDEFTFGDMTISIIEQSRPEIDVNVLNNQSAVIKLTDSTFSLLILGDLGIEGGRMLLEKDSDKIKADGVQMAHHGQLGVEKDVYEAIEAKYAFWPTPKWLWDNTRYLGNGTPGSGSFQTPEVIEWMKELGTFNVTSFENTVVFDTDNKEVTPVQKLS